ncbi:MAG: hypothetical protein JNL80_13270 [Phycisphaerae bacterium]|nr:hypothetical protein [Phycisphaerae bacterium]
MKCTPEHPILIRRDDQWGFVSAEFVEVGAALFLDGLGEEVLANVERIAGRVRTVAIHVPTTNTLLVDGVWAHSDISLSALSPTSTSSSSSSGSSKSSGSSFSCSSGTIAPSVLTSGGSSSLGVSASSGSSNNTAV